MYHLKHDMFSTTNVPTFKNSFNCVCFYFSFTKSESEQNQYIIHRLFRRIMHNRETNRPDKQNEGQPEVSIKVDGSDKGHDECVRCACANSHNISHSFTNATYCNSEGDDGVATTTIRLNLPASPIRKSAETYSIVDLNKDG